MCACACVCIYGGYFYGLLVFDLIVGNRERNYFLTMYVGIAGWRCLLCGRRGDGNCFDASLRVWSLWDPDDDLK